MTDKEKSNRGGRPAKQGGFSIMVRHGNKAVRRTRLRAYLTSIREGLIRDLGPTEQDLTTAELILIDRVLSKLCVLRAIEERISELGIFRGVNRAELQHTLQANYLAYSNSIRLSLQALGISRRAGERVLSPLEIAAQIDAEKARDAQPPVGDGGAQGPGEDSRNVAPGEGKGAGTTEGGDGSGGGPGIARPGASQGEISGEEGRDESE